MNMLTRQTGGSSLGPRSSSRQTDGTKQ